MRIQLDIPDNATPEEIRALLDRITTAAMDDAWQDQDGDIYLPRPGDHAAQLAEDWGIDYETALVFCNCD